MATKRPTEENGYLSDKGDDSETKKPKSNTPGGTLLFSGATDWKHVNRKANELNLSPNTMWQPVRLQALVDVKVVSVSSSPCSVHMFAITDNGEVYGWGRNEQGQLGIGDREDRKCPTLVKELTKYKIVSVATGRNHSLFLTEDGIVFACGDNGSGQTVGGASTATNVTPKPIRYNGQDIVKIACGADFSMIVDKEGSVWSWGHPEYGQLGHNTDGSSIEGGKKKIQFDYVYSPKKIQVWVEKDPKTKDTAIIENVVVKEISCGNNHTVVIDEKFRAFSWGFGGYGRLGHAQTGDEKVPRLIKYLDGPRRGIKKIVCGGQFSFAVSECSGVCYMWGIYTPGKEANMYPKPINDLYGWAVRSIGCSYKGWMVAAENSVIGCGPSPCYGEMALGDETNKKGEMKKCSSPPTIIKTLDKVHVLECGTGYGHSLFIARNESEEDQKAIDSYKIIDQSDLD